MKLREFLNGQRNRKSLGKDKRLALWKRVHGRCFYCGEETPKTWFVLEHVEPRSRGGANGPSNLVVACVPCDKEKGARNLVEFKAHRGVDKFYGETFRARLIQQSYSQTKRERRSQKRERWRERNRRPLSNPLEGVWVRTLDTLIVNAPDWPTTKRYMEIRHDVVSGRLH